MEKPILIGAVAYDPRVVPIWEGMRDYFREAGLPIDYVLFSNYERQVRGLLERQIDIAWNTNLAWAKVHRRTGGTCRALAMRDVDVQFKTILVARADSGVRSLTDLRGKRLALGSADSAQAAILPLHYLQLAGLNSTKDCTIVRFDVDVGKHGDTGTSELDVLKALQEGRADAGALGDTTWIRQVAEGRVDSKRLQPVWSSPAYCHCNFTVLGDFPVDRGEGWIIALMGMHYENPRWRPLMDLEGLKRWVRADTDIMAGYQVVFDAIERQGLDQNPEA
jgi:ABC-type phosphate/phosphonate transport system substrate-binding protein